MSKTIIDFNNEALILIDYACGDVQNVREWKDLYKDHFKSRNIPEKHWSEIYNEALMLSFMP